MRIFGCMKHILTIILAAVCVGNACAASFNLEWIEADSTQAIQNRIKADFPYSLSQGLAIIQRNHPDIDLDSLYKLIECKAIETMTIDGREMVYRKSPRNMERILAKQNGTWTSRGGASSPQRQAYADTIIRCTRGSLNFGHRHLIHYRMSIAVPYIETLRGDTLRAWMPIPKITQRQEKRKITPIHPAEGVIYGDDDAHSGIYLEQPVTEGDTTRFEIDVEYTTIGQYFDPDSILANLRPYVHDDNYVRNTRFEAPHIIDLAELAHKIVGDEKNPFRQSEMVYDYISSNYPWAGAREYSTIPCIPGYVVSRGYGDCGQVALLYISLMRSLGVPARWESGWMLHPGEVGIHDWAEVYFEGVGWVPVDVSFGRYTNAADPAVRNFYSTGMDAYRMAANKGVGRPFGVAKRFVRSETVDSQVGEVECSKGNLFYPLWDYDLTVIDIQEF